MILKDTQFPNGALKFRAGIKDSPRWLPCPRLLWTSFWAFPTQDGSPQDHTGRIIVFSPFLPAIPDCCAVHRNAPSACINTHNSFRITES